MKKSIDDQWIEIYYFVDDCLKKHPKFAQGRESNHHTPQVSDAEVIPLALRQGSFGWVTRSQPSPLVAANARRAVPHWCSYQQGMARWHAWSPWIGLWVLVSGARPAEEMNLFRIDSKPIPVCHPLRHGRVRLLREEGGWFGKTKQGGFFGFNLHAMVNQRGWVVGVRLTPANSDARDPALALAWAREGGGCLADWGDRSKDVQDLLSDEADWLWITTAEAPEKRPVISSLRERVETTFSQLWDRFLDRIFSRSWNGSWNTMKLKMLHLNLCLNGIIG